MRVSSAVALLALLSIEAAFAEGIKDEMNSFGLVGSWSVDCAKDIRMEIGSRVTFLAPLFGTPTFGSISKVADGVVAFKYGITSAETITQDKIRLTLHPMEMTSPSPSTMALDKRELQAVYERVGSKLHVVDYKTTDGAVISAEGGISRLTGMPTPLLEKCLN